MAVRELKKEKAIKEDEILDSVVLSRLSPVVEKDHQTTVTIERLEIESLLFSHLIPNCSKSWTEIGFSGRYRPRSQGNRYFKAILICSKWE